MRRAPFLYSALIAPKHALTRAGRIYQHTVEKAAQRTAEHIRPTGTDNRICNPKTLNVGKQTVCAAVHNLIAPQKAAALQTACNLSALSTRCRTQVQYAFPRLRGQCCYRGGRTGLLHIKGTGVVQRLSAGTKRLWHIIRERRKWCFF
jgi:hypothetical protein